MYKFNNLKIILMVCIILILCFSLYKFMEPFQNVCQNECINIGTPIGNCLCLDCCKKNKCDPLKKSLLNFMDMGDTIDCQLLS